MIKKNNSLLSILQKIIDKPYLIQKNLININLKDLVPILIARYFLVVL